MEIGERIQVLNEKLGTASKFVGASLQFDVSCFCLQLDAIHNHLNNRARLIVFMWS